MAENENYGIIGQTIHEVELEEPEYINIQDNENIPQMQSNNNYYENNSCIPFYNNISPPEILLNYPNARLYYSASNNNKAKSYKQLIPINPKEDIIQNFNQNNYGIINSKNNYRTLNNKNNEIYRKNNFINNVSPIYLTNKNKNKNNSQIINGYTTDEGESNINYNRDSNLDSQIPCQGISVIYPQDENENINDENINTYDTNDEQLIIFPDSNENKKLFDPKTKEGILQNKNYQIYQINCVEYSPDDLHKCKPVSFGDYILKNPNNKMRKNKSCTNININKRDINDYEIKLLKNKKKEKKNGKKIISCDKIYNIKTIKGKNKSINKREETNSSNRDNKTKEKKILKVLGHFNKSKEKEKVDEEKNTLVYYDKKIYNRKYNTNYNMNNNNNGLTRYQKWKIIASACLIQSWWRSLKILYKKYLNKIIIIQKVYRIHYKSKSLVKESKNYLVPKLNKKANEKINTRNYLSRNDNLNLQKYKEPQKIKNSKYVHKKKKPSNRPSLNKPAIEQKEFSFSSKNSFNNKYNIAILLIKKIIENCLIKTFNGIINSIKNNNLEDKNLNKEIDTNKQIKKIFNSISINNDNSFSIFKENKSNLNPKFNEDNNLKDNTFNNLNIKKTKTEDLSKFNDISFSFISPNQKTKETKKNILLINKNLELSIINKDNKSLNNKNEINKGNKSINNLIFKNSKNEKPNEEDNLQDISNNKHIEKKKASNNYTNAINKRNYDKNSNSFIKEKSKDSADKNRHILYSNLMKYVFDKIKKEVKRRKLIVCFKNINLRKYPCLCYAFKKIKKFAKVRYRVMNEYASIIQNTFRYYLENKKKEENQEYQENNKLKLEDKKI